MKRFFSIIIAFAAGIMCFSACGKFDTGGQEDLVVEYAEITSFAVQNCDLTILTGNNQSVLLERSGIVIEVKSHNAETTVYDQFDKEMMKFVDGDTGMYAAYLTGVTHKELLFVILARNVSFGGVPDSFTEDQIIARINPRSETSWVMQYKKR